MLKQELPLFDVSMRRDTGNSEFTIGSVLVVNCSVTYH
jgi:hypothetical protein